MIEIAKLKEFLWGFLIYFGITALLIFAMKSGISQYNSIPAINIVLTSWTHHGEQFMWGNIKGFLLTFPILMIVACRTRSLLPTAAGILILWPLFSFISQSLTGGYSPKSWGFSGYLYAFYGAIIYFTAIGAYNHQNNKYFRAISVFTILLIAGIPLIFTPAIFHIGSITYYISTRVHLLGFVFGLMIPAIIQYPDLQSNRYWVFGGLAIAMELYQFSRILPYI